ncbi:hypothetical protein EDD22DRAFT_852043 [Suillus occidentalis]|nr:hypothetical protein EDD22DRAFT_852043 [Suillus occidentalis]
MKLIQVVSLIILAAASANARGTEVLTALAPRHTIAPLNHLRTVHQGHMPTSGRNRAGCVAMMPEGTLDISVLNRKIDYLAQIELPGEAQAETLSWRTPSLEIRDRDYSSRIRKPPSYLFFL